jgi:hypothetical protein
MKQKTLYSAEVDLECLLCLLFILLLLRNQEILSYKAVAQAAGSTIYLSHQRHKYCRPRLEMSNFH